VPVQASTPGRELSGATIRQAGNEGGPGNGARSSLARGRPSFTLHGSGEFECEGLKTHLMRHEMSSGDAGELAERRSSEAGRDRYVNTGMGVGTYWEPVPAS
jgi:hypothetical protein